MSSLCGTATVTRLRGRGTWLLALDGDHDIGTIPLLERLTESLSPDCTRAIVDLTDASFIDGSTINWLLRTSRVGSKTGRFAVSIVCGASGAAVQRLLHAVRLEDALPCFANQNDALGAVGGERAGEIRRLPPASGGSAAMGTRLPHGINGRSSRTLRVLVADERRENLERLSDMVTRLGHTLTAKETNIAAVAAMTEAEPPDVALVVVGDNSGGALELIGSIVREASCPVIAVLDVEDSAFVRRAAKCGVFAYIVSGDAGDEQLASSIEVVLHRFAEYHDLQGAFGRRAITERAKGVLMERHSIDEEAAFLMLRDHSRTGNRKLIDIAQALLDARDLLPNTGGAAEA